MINFLLLIGSLVNLFHSTICKILFLFLARVDPPVYPYFDIYPAGRSSVQPPRERRSTATPGKLNVSIKIGAAYPQFDICEFVSLGLPSHLIGLEFDYTNLFGSSVLRFHLDPAVYPNFDIYPTIRGTAVKTRIAGQYCWLLVSPKLYLLGFQSPVNNTYSTSCGHFGPFVPRYRDLSV